MSEAYLTNWSFGGETPGTRNHEHETALREARFATEYRQVESPSPARAGFLTRLRLAFMKQSANEGCSCPA